MRCPHCGRDEDKVIESRPNADGTSVRRRRECLSCGYRFTSYEHIDEKPLKVIKRDGRREPFDRVKLERGIQVSLGGRPVSDSVIDDMLQSIEDEAIIKSKNSNEITAAALGEAVLERLYTIDRVAYVRFASVYRMYENVEEFIREIEKLSSKN
jgi:transcriptional repressor NrdR